MFYANISLFFRLRGAEKSGRHLLHELAIANFVFHEPAAQSRLQNAHGIRRFHQIRRPGAPAGVQRTAVLRQARRHQETDQKLRLGNFRLFHAT